MDPISALLIAGACSAAAVRAAKKRQEQKAWEEDAVGRQADAILESMERAMARGRKP